MLHHHTFTADLKFAQHSCALVLFGTFPSCLLCLLSAVCVVPSGDGLCTAFLSSLLFCFVSWRLGGGGIEEGGRNPNAACSLLPQISQDVPHTQGLAACHHTVV